MSFSRMQASLTRPALRGGAVVRLFFLLIMPPETRWLILSVLSLVLLVGAMSLALYGL